jgi:hypothetical protein
VKLTAHLHLVPRSRMGELCLYSPICLHCIVPNYLSTGTTKKEKWFLSVPPCELLNSISLSTFHL